MSGAVALGCFARRYLQDRRGTWGPSADNRARQTRQLLPAGPGQVPADSPDSPSPGSRWSIEQTSAGRPVAIVAACLLLLTIVLCSPIIVQEASEGDSAASPADASFTRPHRGGILT